MCALRNIDRWCQHRVASYRIKQLTSGHVLHFRMFFPIRRQRLQGPIDAVTKAIHFEIGTTWRVFGHYRRDGMGDGLNWA